MSLGDICAAVLLIVLFSQAVNNKRRKRERERERERAHMGFQRIERPSASAARSVIYERDGYIICVERIWSGIRYNTEEGSGWELELA